MILSSLQLEHWGPHIAQDIHIPEDARLVVISGDNDRGKSWIVRAIAAIFLCGPNPYFDQHAIHNGKTHARLQAHLKCKTTTAVLTRTLTRKKSGTTSQILLDHKPINTAELEDFVRSHTQCSSIKTLLALCLSMQGQTHFQLSASRREREDFLRSLCDLTRLNAWREHLKALYTQTHNQLTHTQHTLQGQITALQQLIATQQHALFAHQHALAQIAKGQSAQQLEANAQNAAQRKSLQQHLAHLNNSQQQLHAALKNLCPHASIETLAQQVSTLNAQLNAVREERQQLRHHLALATQYRIHTDLNRARQELAALEHTAPPPLLLSTKDAQTLGHLIDAISQLPPCPEPNADALAQELHTITRTLATHNRQQATRDVFNALLARALRPLNLTPPPDPLNAQTLNALLESLPKPAPDCTHTLTARALIEQLLLPELQELAPLPSNPLELQQRQHQLAIRQEAVNAYQAKKTLLIEPLRQTLNLPATLDEPGILDRAKTALEHHHRACEEHNRYSLQRRELLARIAQLETLHNPATLPPPSAPAPDRPEHIQQRHNALENQETRISQTLDALSRLNAENDALQRQRTQLQTRLQTLATPDAQDPQTLIDQYAQYQQHQTKAAELILSLDKLQCQKTLLQNQITEINTKLNTLKAANEVLNFLHPDNAPRKLLALTMEHIFQEANALAARFDLQMTLTTTDTLDYQVIQSRHGQLIRQNTERLGFGKANILGICTRLATQRILAPHARMAVFDEPFAHLDPMRRTQLVSLLQELTRTLNQPQILVVDHDPEILAAAEHHIRL